ncbi:UDP-N-acetylglucosamine 2-epimerase (non-hydrolyzing) [candidate division WOR-3 bacterium]|nr:UDP-N-acetylglucosamine 2-epimerase (non-hydrolyzing) [candidate division WOR-3 bacterium]
MTTQSVDRLPTKRRVMFCFGTRPEAIKLAPVIQELARHPLEFQPVVLVTAQHRHMLDQVMRVFDITPDHDLNLMKPGQSLADVTAGVLHGVERLLRRVRPDMVMVQGDTTSAFAAALAAFYQQVPVGHVEAGLRTGDKYSPFPEEMNRRLVSGIADLHFAPTQAAKRNLLTEGVPRSRIHVTGNTVVDALKSARLSKAKCSLPLLNDIESKQRVVLVTAHRRESFGPGLGRICQALRRLVSRNPGIDVVYPVHLNPNVRKPVHAILAGIPRVHLIEPLEYLPFVRLMERSYLILTDSGGIQEEAPALGKPVLVMRDVTERPEAVEAGTARLVGTDTDAIVSAAERLFRSDAAYRKMARARNPFGDGRASVRIAAALRRFLRALRTDVEATKARRTRNEQGAIRRSYKLGIDRRGVNRRLRR